MDTFKGNLYRHYKNKLYRVLGECKHSETLEDLVYYECCYKNESGQYWVRPKEMFYSQIEIDGQVKPRFAQIEFKIKNDEQILPEILEEIYPLILNVFKELNKDKFQKTILSQSQVLLLRAYEDEKLVGYKLGYSEGPEDFYSWSGAVDPEYRGSGLGGELMRLQHQWCQEQNFQYVTTKTLNRWPQMISLNLRQGFEIIGTETRTNGEIKLILRKPL